MRSGGFLGPPLLAVALFYLVGELGGLLTPPDFGKPLDDQWVTAVKVTTSVVLFAFGWLFWRRRA